MSIFNKYPICQGEIEITVPPGVTGNLVITTLKENTFICPVKNGVVCVDEEVAEMLLSGNRGAALPGYFKSVVDADAGGTGSGPDLGKILESDDEIREYLTKRGVKFHHALGSEKLKALYAAEMAKENSAKIEPLTADNYSAVATENLGAVLSGVTDTDLLKQLIAAEANGEGQQDRIDLLTVRLSELTV